MRYPIRRRQEGSCAHGRKRRRHSQSRPTRGEGLPVNGRKEAENRRSDCRSGGVPVPGVRRSILATAMPRLHTQRPRQCHGHGNATSKAALRAPKVGTDRRIGLVLPTQTTATAMPRAHAPEPGGWSLSSCRWFGWGDVAAIAHAIRRCGRSPEPANFNQTHHTLSICTKLISSRGGPS